MACGIANATLTTLCEIPYPATSAEMLCTKALKSAVRESVVRMTVESRRTMRTENIRT